MQSIIRGIDRWQRLARAALLIGAVSLPALGTPTPALAAKDRDDGFKHGHIPVTLEIVNPCNDEVVTVSGSIHTRVKTIDKPGHFVYEYHADYTKKLRGESASGRKYMADGSDDYIFTAIGPGPHRSAYVYRFWMKGQGSRNDFQIENTFLTTFGANGEVAAEHVSSKAHCK